MQQTDARQPYFWDAITLTAPFAPRDGAGAIVFKDKMWLLGGWNPWDKVNFSTICNSEVWSSTNGKEWTLEVAKAPWEGRHCAGYVVHQDKMWIVGGDGNHNHYQPDTWSSADGIYWEQVCESAPWGQRSVHYTLVFQDKIWVMGGQTGYFDTPSKGRFLNDVWNSSDGKTWNLVTDNAPWSPRGMIGGSAILNDRMWILGGGSYNSQGSTFFNDVWSSANGIDWTLHTDYAPWHKRYYHEVAVFDNKLWVMEGFISEGFDYNMNDVWYSSNGVEWKELRYTPWAARHAASIFVYNNGLWMAAGNNMASDIWRLRRAEDEFSHDLWG